MGHGVALGNSTQNNQRKPSVRLAPTCLAASLGNIERWAVAPCTERNMVLHVHTHRDTYDMIRRRTRQTNRQTRPHPHASQTERGTGRHADRHKDRAGTIQSGMDLLNERKMQCTERTSFEATKSPKTRQKPVMELHRLPSSKRRGSFLCTLPLHLT